MQRQLDHADLLVAAGHKLNLAEVDAAFTADFKDKDDAKDKLDGDIKHLAELQDMFYADRRYALLLIFQGMDTAGKDGAIRHVMSGVSPQGVDVSSFKQPSPQELAHDYLWRCARVLPERGRIGIFTALITKNLQLSAFTVRFSSANGCHPNPPPFANPVIAHIAQNAALYATLTPPATTAPATATPTATAPVVATPVAAAAGVTASSATAAPAAPPSPTASVLYGDSGEMVQAYGAVALIEPPLAFAPIYVRPLSPPSPRCPRVANPAHRTD